MKFRSKIGVFWIVTLCTCGWLNWELFKNIMKEFNWLGVLVMFPCDLLFINLTMDTWYTLHDDYLEIKAGIFCHLKIPYSDIVQFYETKNPMSSVGLSIDRIDLKFKSQGGNGIDEALISPVHKKEFIHELESKTHLVLTEK